MTETQRIIVLLTAIDNRLARIERAMCSTDAVADKTVTRLFLPFLAGDVPIAGKIS